MDPFAGKDEISSETTSILIYRDAILSVKVIINPNKVTGWSLRSNSSPQWDLLYWQDAIFISNSLKETDDSLLKAKTIA